MALNKRSIAQFKHPQFYQLVVKKIISHVLGGFDLEYGHGRLTERCSSKEADVEMKLTRSEKWKTIRRSS
jgi:hypothetical protein